MKLSEVITLLGAGYTKDEINAFQMMEDGKPETAKQAEQAKLETPETAKQSEPVKPETPETVKQSDYSALLKEVKELKEAVQINNARHSSQPNDNINSIAKDADDALMTVYNL